MACRSKTNNTIVLLVPRLLRHNNSVVAFTNSTALLSIVICLTSVPNSNFLRDRWRGTTDWLINRASKRPKCQRTTAEVFGDRPLSLFPTLSASFNQCTDTINAYVVGVALQILLLFGLIGFMCHLRILIMFFWTFVVRQKIGYWQYWEEIKWKKPKMDEWH